MSEEINTLNIEEVLPPDNKQAITEGMLYVLGEDGASLQQLAIALQVSQEDMEALLINIQHKYASEQFGIELVCFGGIYKFISKKEIGDYIKALFGESKPVFLSQSALETLAIIAYKQPITRVEIEELRGVSAEVMLRKLLARNLIQEVGRSDAPGRPILYEVSQEFMDSFKLYTLNELPDLPTFNQENENENLFD